MCGSHCPFLDDNPSGSIVSGKETLDYERAFTFGERDRRAELPYDVGRHLPRASDTAKRGYRHGYRAITSFGRMRSGL